MKNFLSAIRFITILPAGKSDHFDAVGMVPWFPAVGLLLGVGLAAFDHAAGRMWPPQAAAVLDVVFLAVLTGAFHIDGLADTADGLFSHRPKARMLEIMKDSRIGAMGVVAVVSVLAVKWAGISGLSENRTTLLILVPAYARGAMLFGMRALEYGRPQGGTGLSFFSRKLRPADLWGVLATVGLSVALGRGLLAVNVGFFLIGAALIAYYRKRLGCITGDMLGAMAEVTEAGLFLIAAMGGGR
jgi:adenosylcobinamide-GDP ribazoletransferase